MTTSDRPDGTEEDLHSPSFRLSIGNWLRRSRWMIPLVLIGVLLILAVIYYGAGYLIVRQINVSYDRLDCTSILELSQPAEKIYSVKTAPFVKSAFAQAAECQGYLRATQEEEWAAWSSAYADYQTYLQKYPQGQFLTEVRQGAAQSLLGWAEEQRKNGDYSESVNHLLTILDEFGDTPSNGDAKFMLASVYLEWGKYLQDQKSYSEADEKYQKAVETDPDSQSASGPATQARTALPILYQAWGQSLIQQQRFSEAVDRFGKAINVSKAEDVPARQDVLSQAYLQWAEDLRGAEDFLSALDRIELAKNSAASNATKANIDARRAETLTAFSQSDGTQARQIMDETVKALCLDGKPAQSPIIAMDSNTVRAYPLLTALYGSVNRSDLVLSDQVAAQTPGSFHYAVCLRGDERQIQYCPYTGGYHIERWQYYWSVKLQDVGSGKVYKQTEIAGGTPATCPGSYLFTRGITTETFYGSAPKDGDLDAWLSKVLKGAPAAKLHPPLAPTIFDTFDHNNYGWYTGDYQDDYVTATRQLEGGRFNWVYHAIRPSRLTSVPDMKLVADFQLSVKAQRTKGPLDGSYGLLFRRLDKNDFYNFVISDSQYFAVLLLKDDQWTTLIDWTFTDAIQPGGANVLKVEGCGSHFTFFVNDQNVGEMDDETFKEGIAGLIAELSHAGDNGTFVFDDFKSIETSGAASQN